jgi:hypothetical protein
MKFIMLISLILATVLAKMSNLIPEGGIWMNTQRPEWNDANNVVGNGVPWLPYVILRKILSANHRKIHIRKRKKFLENRAFIMPLGECLLANQGLLSDK